MSEILSNVEIIEIESEIDNDYRSFDYRITEENDIRITENEEPREV